jgi:hypothetical protein
MEIVGTTTLLILLTGTICVMCVCSIVLSILQSAARRNDRYDKGVLSSVYILLFLAFLWFTYPIFMYWAVGADSVFEVPMSPTGLLFLNAFLSFHFIGRFFGARKMIGSLSKSPRAIVLSGFVFISLAGLGTLDFLANWAFSLRLTEKQLNGLSWLSGCIILLAVISYLIAFSVWSALRRKLLPALEESKSNLPVGADAEGMLQVP